MSKRKKLVIGIGSILIVAIIVVIIRCVVSAKQYNSLIAELQHTQESYDALYSATEDCRYYADEVQATEQFLAAVENPDYCSLYERDGRVYYQDDSQAITIYLINDPADTVTAKTADGTILESYTLQMPYQSFAKYGSSIPTYTNTSGTSVPRYLPRWRIYNTEHQVIAAGDGTIYNPEIQTDQPLQPGQHFIQFIDHIYE